MINRAFVAGALAAALMAVAGIARADSSLGQLVYNFTYGSDQQVTARDQQNNMDIGPSSTSNEHGGSTTGGAESTSGISDYHGKLDDKGTMTVDIVSRQPDKGLVVTISEQGQNTRRAPPATCVVYGDTRVICDPNKTVYQEEYTLLRFLGANFVDPSQLDANKHWAIDQAGQMNTVKADYTVTSNANGSMQISESRKIIPNGGGSQTTDIQTKIGYDTTRSVPTSIDEYTTQRQDNGVSGTTTTIYQTTLQLVSDSTAKT
jgi:hypothetical protein